MQHFEDHYSQLQHLQMLIYVKALPALLSCTRECGYLYWRRSITLQWGCVCFGEDRADRQTHTKSTITPPSGEAANYWLCVYVCLLNVWLAGSGVGVVRTLEATSWRTTSDPTHLPRCILTPSVRSDGDSCFALKQYNRAASWSSTAVGHFPEESTKCIFTVNQCNISNLIDQTANCSTMFSKQLPSPSWM